MTNTRIERDPLGEKAVPADALYGIQTLRAAENFPISGLRPLPAFVDAVVWIKRSAALAHKQTGRLEPPPGRCHRPGRRRGPRGPASRSVRRGCVSGGRGHQPQHERQRGARQPGQRDARERPRQLRAGASQRSRQHGAEHQRRDPHRHAPRYAGHAAGDARRDGSAGRLAAASAAGRSTTSSSRAAPTFRTPRRSGWDRSSPPTGTPSSAIARSWRRRPTGCAR